MTRGNLGTAGSVSAKVISSRQSAAAPSIPPSTTTSLNFETFSSSHFGVSRQLRSAGRVTEGLEAAVYVSTGPLGKCQDRDDLEEARGRVAPLRRRQRRRFHYSAAASPRRWQAIINTESPLMKTSRRLLRGAPSYLLRKTSRNIYKVRQGPWRRG